MHDMVLTKSNITLVLALLISHMNPHQKLDDRTKWLKSDVLLVVFDMQSMTAMSLGTLCSFALRHPFNFKDGC